MPTTMTTPKLDISPDQARRVGQMIQEEIKRSLLKNKSIYDHAKSRQQAYNQITKCQAQNREQDKPWKGAADYFIALIEWTVDAVWARVLQTLFSQEPYMTATGETGDDKPKEQGVTQFTDMVLREKVRLYDNINFYFKQPLVIPFATLKYDWLRDFDTIIKKGDADMWVSPQGEEKFILPDDPNAMMQAMTYQANGYQNQGQQEVWVAQDVPLYDAPKAQYIRQEDYVWAPGAKRDVPLYWEGDRVWFTANDLKKYARQEKFRKEAVDSITEKTVAGREGADKDIAPRTELIECFWWYGRLPMNAQGEINLDDPEAMEQETICLISYKEPVELLYIGLWDKRRLPNPDRVYLRLQFEETEEWTGRSLADKLFMTNRYLNDWFNTIMNNAYIAMTKIFVKKSTLAGEAWEKPPLFPGVMWTEDQAGDVRALDVGDVKSIGLTLQQDLLNFAERISNVSIYTTGANRERGQKTLGEVQATIRESNIGMDKYLQRCHNILREICKWTVDYYYDNMPPGFERRLLGEGGEVIYPTQQNLGQYQQQNINPFWSKDDIAGQFDFTWRGTSLNSSKEWQLAVSDNLMDRYLPHPMIAQNMLATWEILKRGLEARGVKDWENILPKREAIIAEMQKMQAEAQQAQQEQAIAKGRAGQPNVGQRVVKKLTEGGMPAGEALKAVKGRLQNEKAIATA